MIARPLFRVRVMQRRYEESESNGRWASALMFAARYPKLGWMHLRSLWYAQTRSNLDRLMKKGTIRALLLFLLIRPLFGVRYVLPNIRLGKKDEEHSPADDSLTVDPETAEQEAAPEENTLKMLDEAEELMLNQQIVSAAERQIDGKIFGGRDHEEDRFVRLALRNSYHDFKLDGIDQEQHVVFEPRLLMHESGILQLSVRISSTGPLSTAQVIDLMWGPARRITRSELAAPLLKGSGWERDVTEWRDVLDGGARLALIEHENPVSISDFLTAQMNSIIASIGVRLEGWVVYPTAMVEAGDCCTLHEWKTRHREDIVRLATRSMTATRMSPTEDTPSDLSLQSDHSLYASLGSTTYIQWTGAIPHGLAELGTVLVIEYGLLLYLRLQTMEAVVARMVLGERRLKRRYRDAILLFSELRQGNVRAGEAREVVRHLLSELGADQIRPTIQAALELAGLAHSTVAASRASRRAWWVTLGGTVVAVLVSIPALQQLLVSVSALETDDGAEWAIAPLRYASTFGFWGAWLVLAWIACALITTLVGGWIVRLWPGRFPSIRRGYAWPTKLIVRERTQEDISADSA
ncbi:hypothetical protein [Agreia bicolorata]|uniref:hypothetical protein n=1 Tax=Agreia bicolorata TaxID=110935 RepID=UPI00126A5F48|nr:hypothetical protein [Agreia bicolorata]